MKDKVMAVLEKIKPILASDGGSVELVDVDEKTGIVKVKLTGACGSCPFSTMTFKGVVEKMIKEDIPEVTQVVMG